MTSGAAVMISDAVTYGYEPGQPVVRDFSAGLVPGRLCALIGPNAAGKSTLIRLLLGQLRPWSGKVRLDGSEVFAMATRRRAARISFVPQHGSCGFAFTARRIVEMGRFALPSLERETVEQVLGMCDLDALAHRVYATLSAGQQQRVLLARALAQSWDLGAVMLLDEPGSAMDLWHLHRTMRLLVKRARQGLAVLVVLHDLNLAVRYADDVWLVNEGRLVAAGPWEQVLVPRVLEPVYRVGLGVVQRKEDERPVFIVDSEDRM